MKLNQKVILKPQLKEEFPQFLEGIPYGTSGIVDAVKLVMGVEIVIVTFDNGVIKKLPSAFLGVVLRHDLRVPSSL